MDGNATFLAPHKTSVRNEVRNRFRLFALALLPLACIRFFGSGGEGGAARRNRAAGRPPAFGWMLNVRC